MRETAEYFAGALLRNFAWTKGQVLALVSENSIHVSPVIWGTLYTGGIVTPLNPGYRPEELIHHLRVSSARVIVTQQALVPHVAQAATALGIPHNHIVILPDVRTCVSPFSAIGDIREFADLIQEGRETAHKAQVPKAQIDPDNDVAFLVFSSGT
jgi:4-coumarate--CoA ligase